MSFYCPSSPSRINFPQALVSQSRCSVAAASGVLSRVNTVSSTSSISSGGALISQRMGPVSLSSLTCSMPQLSSMRSLGGSLFPTMPTPIPGGIPGNVSCISTSATSGCAVGPGASSEGGVDGGGSGEDGEDAPPRRGWPPRDNPPPPQRQAQRVMEDPMARLMASRGMPLGMSVGKNAGEWKETASLLSHSHTAALTMFSSPFLHM